MLHPSNLIGKQVDQFRLDEFIAKGAMGMVFKAFDTVLARTVSLKLISKLVDVDLIDEEVAIHEEARKRLIMEAKAAGRLNHPNILTIYSYGETREFEYICMEYLPGKTLNQVLSRNKTMDVEQAMDILEQILLALEAADKEQIVHRDIKPSNIMIGENGRVKVMDFGIAKLPSFSMTTSGTVLGTPFYMSPEQVSGQKVDIRSDIFSVGAVLYKIVTGELPFDATNTATLAYKIVQVDPIPPDVLNVHVPNPLGNLLKKALAKKPADRYQTPAEMLQALSVVRSRKGRSLEQDAATILARDSEAEKTVLAKLVNLHSAVRSEAAGMRGGAGAGEASGTLNRKARVVDFRRDQEPEEGRQSAPQTAVTLEDVEPFPGPDLVESDSHEWEGPEETTTTGPPSLSEDQPVQPLTRITRRQRDRGVSGSPGGRSYRTVGVMAVLLIVAAFWYVAYHAFREIREGVAPAGDSSKSAQQAKAPTESTSLSPQTEVAPSATIPSTEDTQSPARSSVPSSEPAAEQLLAEAKGFWSSDPARAQKLLERAVGLYPNHFEASFQLGRILASRMDYGAAVQQYERVLGINDQNPEVLFNLGYIYLTQGNYDAAIQYLQACSVLKPSFQDEVLTNLGISYLKKNMPDRAEALFKQALNINPANQVAKGYLATVSLSNVGGIPADRELDATKPFVTPAQEEPADLLVEQAKTQMEKDPALARKLLEDAIAENPNHFEAVFQLGRLFTFQKEYPAAVKHYQRSLELNEQSADAHFNLGYIHLISKDYDQAITQYESCLTLSPPYKDEVLTNLGLAHLRKGNVSQARKLFMEALDLKPANDVARGYLRSIDRKRGGRSEATQPSRFSGFASYQPQAPSGMQGAALASVAGPRRSIEGEYVVEGSNPSGSSYKGKAAISRKGDEYMVTWTVAGEKFAGNGTLAKDVLTVKWEASNGASGTVNYQVNPDGTLKGDWSEGAGTETLVPVH
jgi:serine/threonine-protein kinase